MDSVDNEILAVRAQIEALRQRRSLLSTSLLSSSRTQALLKRPTASNPQIESKQRRHVLSVIERTATALSASVRRSTCGITAFRATDPDPNAVANGHMIGVRLDVYSPKQHSFDAPYFLLFQKLERSCLKLHQHTIPAFVPIRSLLRRYMSLAPHDGSDHSHGISKQNLTAFVRGVRRELVAAARRRDELAVVEESIANKQGRFNIKAVEHVDPSARNVQLLLRNGLVLRLRLGLFADVEKCSVGSQDVGARRDKRVLENALAGYTGSIGELQQKLQDIENQ